MNNIDFLHFCTYNTSDNLYKCIEIAKILLTFHHIFVHWSEMVVGAPLEMIFNKKTPDSNVSDPDKKAVQIWAHNSQ